MRLALVDPRSGDVVNIVEGEVDVVARMFRGRFDVVQLDDDTSAAEPGALCVDAGGGKVRITRPRDGYSTVHDAPAPVPVDAGDAEEDTP